jgi:serine/threonine-protein kinase HipA
MSLGGKRDGFTLDDLIIGGRTAGISAGVVRLILEEVTEAVSQWPSVAAEVGVKPGFIEDITANLRLSIA